MADGVAKKWDAHSRLNGVEVGPWRREYEPGWHPPDCGRDDECMRASFACVTGVHPLKMPWIPPGEGHTDSFWRTYRLLAMILGFEWQERIDVTMDEPVKRHPWCFADDELWIAGVGRTGDGRGSGSPHAIVMRGQKLFYDCCWEFGKGHGRQRRPTRVGWGVRLAPQIHEP